MKIYILQLCHVSFQQTDLSKLNIVEMNEIQMANYLT